MTTTRSQTGQLQNEITTRLLQSFVSAAGGTDPLTGFMNELARMVHGATYQTNIDDAQVAHGQIIDSENNVIARVIHSGNNQIIEILDRRLISPDQIDFAMPAIIQISSQKESTQKAKQLLSRSIQPSYLAREGKALQASMVDPSDQSTDRLSYVLTVMEAGRCTLLSTQNQIPDDKRIEFTFNLGIQFSRMLTDLRNTGVLWTDVKPGNILFRVRESNQLELFISDPKGLVAASMLKSARTSGRQGKEFIKLEDITPQYHSQHFMNILRENAISTREQAAHMIEEEYSYQLAILLYAAATGNEPELLPLTFDFTLPIFTDPNMNHGRNLKTLIENLSNDNPSSRLLHAEAIKLLPYLKLAPDAFNQRLGVAIQKRTQSPTPIPEIVPEPRRHNSTGSINDALESESKKKHKSTIGDKFRKLKLSKSDGDKPSKSSSTRLGRPNLSKTFSDVFRKNEVTKPDESSSVKRDDDGSLLNKRKPN